MYVVLMSRTVYENDIVHIRRIDVEHNDVLAETTTLWYLTLPQVQQRLVEI